MQKLHADKENNTRVFHTRVFPIFIKGMVPMNGANNFALCMLGFFFKILAICYFFRNNLSGMTSEC